MKKFNKLVGLMVFSLSSLMLLNDAKADTLETCLEGTGDTICTYSGDVVSLSNDIDVVGTKTLDLSSNTLTLSGHKINVGSSANLTIKNGTITRGDRSINVVVEAGGTLKLEGATLTGTNDTVATLTIYGSSTTSTKVTIDANSTINGTVVIWGKADVTNASGVILDLYGTINQTNQGDGLTINGQVVQNTNPPIVNIYSGANISSTNRQAIYAAGYGVWNIYGGTVTGREALGIKAGEVNIKNGTFKATGAYQSTVTSNPGGPESTGAAISITNTYTQKNGKVKLNIEGGNFESSNGVALYEVKNEDAQDDALESITISNGNFKSADTHPALSLTSTLKNFISGGDFLSGSQKSDVTTYVKQGLVQREDGTVVDPTPAPSPVRNYTVKFIVEGEETSITVKENEKISESDIPEHLKEGYTFAGWYLDKEYTKEFDLTTNITEDITLYAKFTKDEVVEENPKTLDNIMSYVLLGMLSLGALGFVTKKYIRN